MNYATIKWSDDVNGDKMSLSLFVSGCEFNCKNCFNKEAQNKKYGKEFSSEVQDSIIEYFHKNNKYIQTLSILGGEPLEDYNYLDVLSFVKKFKETFPNKTIWIWSGHTYENILRTKTEILEYIDVLCDGVFIEELKDKNLKYVGSKNQRVIDVKKTLNNASIVEYYSQNI